MSIVRFPLRQKLLLGLVVVLGIFLMISFAFNLLEQAVLNGMIFYYGFGVPMFLLVFDTVVDLNNTAVFRTWFILATLMFVLSLTTCNNDKFITDAHPQFDVSSGLNSLILRYSTSSLKALLFFLVAYWPLNKLQNRRGVYIINTNRDNFKYHNLAQRTVTKVDVVINVILYAIIFAAALLGH